MSLSDAPWLDGLDGTSTWKPAQLQQINRPSSVTHNAGSLIGKETRIPRRSISGTSFSTMKKARSPLAPLNKNEHSLLSNNDGSIVIKGTIQQRSKSSSPSKKCASLEWRKRLLDGKVGYGDQTDLFGPSGLENIFAGSDQEPRSERARCNGRLNWLPKSDAAMPSSPPPWPSNIRAAGEKRLAELKMSSSLSASQLDVDLENESPNIDGNHSSVNSNPFELEVSGSVRGDENAKGSEGQAQAQRAASGAERTISGQTILEQEDFSPVILSRHTTVSGTIEYAPISSSVAGKARSHTQAGTVTKSISKPPLAHVEQSIFTDGPSSALDVPPNHDLSLSENLPTGTPEPLNQNVQLKRGGYSVLGSFRHRPLSNEPSVVSHVLPEETSDLLPPAPSPPAHQPALRVIAPSVPKSGSSSPLKLFGPHDTYTNNRLLRRMSEMNEEAADMQQSQTQTPVRNVSQTSFGNGQLNGHRFQAETQAFTPESSRVTYGSDDSPASDIAVPGSKFPTSFQSQNPPDNHLKRGWNTSAVTSRPRLPSKAEQTPYPRHTLADQTPRHNENDSPSKAQADRPKAQSEHKRPPASPLKISTPKRRRTLHASELLDDRKSRAREASNMLFHEVIGKPSRNNSTMVNTSIRINNNAFLGSELNVRPRNPTPSQLAAESFILTDDIREATDDFLAQEDRDAVDDMLDQIEQSMSEADPDTFRERAEVVAAEVARYTIKISKSADHDGSGERKRSVTTQDFFREAECVMQYIRARAAKKPSLLASVEETENIEAQLDPNASLQVPKGQARSDEYMRVSREPSWEDRPRSRWREPEQLRLKREDIDMTRVASQLRKWKEPDIVEEQDVFLVESASDHEVEGDITGHPYRSSSDVAFDERAKIRITGPSSEYAQQIIDSEPGSQRSTQSSANTTRRAENVGTLAPDAVAHLIGHEVGGMTFDKDKQRWVRLRSPEHRAVRNGFLDVQESHLTSEDDPFREISDLAVDEGVEQRRISSPAKFPVTQQLQQDGVSETRAASNESAQTVKQLSASTTVLRPLHSYEEHRSSTTPSRPSCTTGTVDDRRTSTCPTSVTVAMRFPETADNANVAIAADSRVMHVIDDAEASADAGRDLAHAGEFQNDGKNTSTSAPEPDLLSRLREDTMAGDFSDLSELHSSRLRPTVLSSPPAKAPTLHKGLQNPLLNRPHLDAAAFEAREVSEVSFVAPLPGDRLVSVSMSLSKPAQATHKQIGRIIEQDSSPVRYHSSLVLSDLPDFTVHQDDAEQPSEKALAQRFARYAAEEVNDRFAAATKELVKTLTDLYPDEPFWQELHDIDMRSRSLTSLHGLDRFCDNIRGLDISLNELTHLRGVPGSVRTLLATRNQFSSLTSFVHLSNLQYVNVSGNALTTLDVFSSCVHLRELQADDNPITSLSGIKHLDLLQLRCRRSALKHITFHAGDFSCLLKLDLSGSQIDRIEGLEHLESLETLDLSRNRFVNGLSMEKVASSLRHLRLQNCGMQRLDVSHWPYLQSLEVDDNALSIIHGLADLPDLDVLSMRRQQLTEGAHIDIFSQSLEARTVRLSGNKLPKLYIGADQLSLKHLELAGVGLLDLPADFGIRMPNLRSLNLNFNSVRDVRPILHIHGLQELHMCGNRIGRLRKTAAVLTNLCLLRHVDLRDNPIAQSFYPMIMPLPKATSTAVTIMSEHDKEADEDAQLAELERKFYVLADRDAEDEQRHLERLDDDTRLKRRVYDMLMAHSCKSLRRLDGLAFDKALALQKDDVWHRLVELGVVRKVTA